ncbi:MAG TPA: lysylphosphatidylglycerol synthase transmembrane domain-containing protein [Candidatus Saccharimonadales bacterium]
MNKRRLRAVIAIAVLVLTVYLFTRYFIDHPEYWHQLAHVSRWTVLWVILLNIAMLGVLVLMCSATIALCGKRISYKENFILTSYSSIVNFFGPLQSGPGVRGIYLKTRHQIRLRDYTFASLLGLGFFAFFSALFLLVGTRPWWQTVGALIVVSGASWAVLRWFKKRDTHAKESQFGLRSGPLAALFILAFVQVAITVAWYYIELRAVNPHIHFSQAMSYAGAANFSLFVSLTPDAVGIREAFLVFSQHIHHVSTGDIVSANLIDRASYILFLGLLFLLVLSLHAKDRLQLTKLRRSAAQANQQ